MGWLFVVSGSFCQRHGSGVRPGLARNRGPNTIVPVSQQIQNTESEWDGKKKKKKDTYFLSEMVLGRFRQNPLTENPPEGHGRSEGRLRGNTTTSESMCLLEAGVEMKICGTGKN